MSQDMQLTSEINSILGINNAKVIHVTDLGMSLSIFCRDIQLDSMEPMLDWCADNSISDLTLNDCSLTNGHITSIIAHKICSELKTLDIRGNGITPTSAALISRCERLRNLLAIDVSETSIGNKGAILIIDALETVLASVEYLGLSCVGMREDGYQRLLNTPAAGRLRKIDISQSPIRSSTLKLLERKYGDRMYG